MPIDLQCDQCRKRYRVKDSLAGRTIKCKQCEAKIAVPDFMEEEEDWGEYEPEPALPRKKSKKKKSAANKHDAPGKPGIGKRVFGVIGMIVGVTIVLGCIMMIFEGNGRATRGVVTGGIITAVSFRWVRGG